MAPHVFETASTAFDLLWFGSDDTRTDCNLYYVIKKDHPGLFQSYVLYIHYIDMLMLLQLQTTPRSFSNGSTKIAFR